MMTVVKKEYAEMFRDPIRVAATLAVPIVLMFLFSSGMNLDVKNLPFVVLDMDDTMQSRQYADAFINSPYYDYRGHVRSDSEAKNALQVNNIKFYIDIPPGFGRNMHSDKGAQIGVFIDGTLPFRAESVRGYVMGTNAVYINNNLAEQFGQIEKLSNFDIKSRFWYNQASESKYTFVPGVIAIILITIPAITMTLSIVREKEYGTITNFYATPLTKLEFLVGKQFIYIILFSMVYFILVAIAVFFYQVPIKGSFLIMSVIAVAYIFCTTAIGLFVSSFVKSQIAGLLITLIGTMIPAMTFSGMMRPISSLDESGQMMAKLYPTGHFVNTTIGTFTKDLPLSSILPNLFYLIIFYIVIMALCNFLLKKQET